MSTVVAEPPGHEVLTALKRESLLDPATAAADVEGAEIPPELPKPSQPRAVDGSYPFNNPPSYSITRTKCNTLMAGIVPQNFDLASILAVDNTSAHPIP